MDLITRAELEKELKKALDHAQDMRLDMMGRIEILEKQVKNLAHHYYHTVEREIYGGATEEGLEEIAEWAFEEREGSDGDKISGNDSEKTGTTTVCEGDAIRDVRDVDNDGDIATAIKRMRNRRNLSQTELAKRTGLQPSAISHFECGQRVPSVQNAIKLAQALRCSLDALLGVGAGERSEDESQVG